MTEVATERLQQTVHETGRRLAAAIEQAQRRADQLRHDPTAQNQRARNDAVAQVELLQLRRQREEEQLLEARKVEARATIERTDNAAKEIIGTARAMTDAVEAASAQLEAAFGAFGVARRQLSKLSGQANAARATLDEPADQYRIGMLPIEGLRRRLEKLVNTYDLAKKG
jgi:hypothetical protein